MVAEAISKPKNPKVESKKSLFGEMKDAKLVIYKMIKKNPKLRQDTPEYPPYRNFKNTDIIRWNYGTEAEPEWGERAIRYLNGHPSIFVDEQEAGNRVIPERVLNNPKNQFELNNGIIAVASHELVKLKYLDFTNLNEDSPYSTGKVQPLFARYSEGKRVQELKKKQTLQKEAMEKAFAASEEQVAFHAKYLDIPIIDRETSATRDYESILTDYRQIAMDDPKKFIETFDDEDLKLKYKIETAIENNFINLKLIQGKAVFTATKEEICDVPVSGDIKQVVDTLFIFSQKKEGTLLVKKLNDL